MDTPKRRYKGRGETAEAWESQYLDVLERTGNKSLAAKAVELSTRHVKLLRESNPAFSERWEAAYDHYLDKVETELGEMKNPIAKIARLRADRPARYLDKLQVAGVIGHVHAAPPQAEIEALLRNMLAGSMPETRAQIAGDVIDADSPDQPKE